MQRDLNGLVSRLHELDLKETEGRVRREELLQEARRRHAVESAEALLGAHDPGRDLEEVRARHEELAGKLEAMGPVNLVADEEYRELDERLDFLRTQHDDVVASIKDLEKALRGMTRTAQERFQEAFDGDQPALRGDLLPALRGRARRAAHGAARRRARTIRSSWASS